MQGNALFPSLIIINMQHLYYIQAENDQIECQKIVKMSFIYCFYYSVYISF